MIEEKQSTVGFQEKAKLIINRIGEAGGIPFEDVTFDLTTAVSWLELNKLAEIGEVSNQLSYETVTSPAIQYAIGANVSEQSPDSPVVLALGLDSTDRDQIAKWKTVKPQISEKLRALNNSLRDKLRDSVRIEVRGVVIEEKQQFQRENRSLIARREQINNVIKANIGSMPYQLLKEAESAAIESYFQGSLKQGSEHLKTPLQINAIKVIQYLRENNLSHYPLGEFPDHILRVAKGLVDNGSSLGGVKWVPELEDEIKSQIGSVKNATKEIVDGEKQLRGLISGIKEKYVKDRTQQVDSNKIKEEIQQQIKELENKDKNLIFTQLSDPSQESLLNSAADEITRVITLVRHNMLELDEIDKKLENLSANVTEEEIDQEVGARLESSLNQVVAKLIEKTSASHWTINRAPLFPRLMYIRDRKPSPSPEKLTTRGFEEEIHTDPISGDINLFFPRGMGAFENLELIDIEVNFYRDLVEIYRVSERKPDGEIEGYSLSISDTGVKITYDNGDVSEIKFGESKPFPYLPN